MKRLPVVILLVVAVLVTVVAGCGGMRRHDARLTAADSLMQSDPDSALAIVEGVCRDSLASEGDRAYRDLLLTQARYRCYIPATSDSDISRALAWYRVHDGEREKLTRALIYKGAVMEELSHPDSAMLYYKQAEATAAPDDYFNLGYVNMRMGALYRDHHGLDGKDIQKYELALKYLERSGNKRLLLRCLINLGSLYRLKNPERSIATLTTAKKMAFQDNETIDYRNALLALLDTYYSMNNYDKAFPIVKEISALGLNDNCFEFYATAASIYAKLGMPDSAEYMLGMYHGNPHSGVINEMMYLESLGDIAIARGDTATFRLMEKRCINMEDSLLSFDTAKIMMDIEVSQDNALRESYISKHQVAIRWIFAVIFASLLIFFVFYQIQYRRKHRYDRLISELRERSDRQLTELEELNDKLKALDIKDDQLKSYFDTQLWLLREVMEECYHSPKDKLASKIHQILQLNEHNKEQWNRLNDYLDARFNNIMTETMKNYPQLNEKDLLLLALSTLDFSCIQVSMIMGYTNPSSVGTIKQRLANKMKLDYNLTHYIEQFCN